MDLYSDYGSGGSSMNSSTTWGSSPELDIQWKAASYADLVGGRCSLNDVMQEFRMNGSDAPYNPDDDGLWRPRSDAPGSAPVYARQRSWPASAAERSRMQRPLSASYAAAILAAPPSPVFPPTEVPVPGLYVPQPSTSTVEVLTAEQMRVLNSLPDATVLTVLRELQRRNRQRLPEECRFCKNNGERESFYRAHVLRDGRGRVSCPVLRAYTCARCGATGDHAHTIKYCPRATADERIKSAAMMQSMRMASGRRRCYTPCGASGLQHELAAAAAALQMEPLDSRWFALEQKLLQSRRDMTKNKDRQYKY